jgi:class 3 adenylate cyclase
MGPTPSRSSETRVPTAGELAPDTTTITLVYTDIVSSTEQSEHHGDRGWSRLIARHDEVIRDLVEQGAW